MRQSLMIVITASTFALISSPSVAQTPVVTVVGPIATTTAPGDPAHGYPFSATPMNLAAHGYVEEEFFIQGLANRYTTPAMQTGSVTDGGHAYTTRIVVRRPKSPSRFNGTAIIEWTNVSQGHDNEVDWFQSGAHFVRAGFAWVGVSAQRVGVEALKQWSPGRYGTLDVSESGTITNDALSYDILSAAARAVRGQGSASVMGPLKVERLIATGHSQSAGRLYTYFTSVHPVAPVFDGVVLHGGGGKIRPDLAVKVWKFLAETDVPGQVANRQPDTDSLRTWEVAGTSHLDAQLSRGLGSVGLRAAGGTPVDGLPAGRPISGGGAGIGNFQAASGQPNDGCARPIFSRVPSHYVQNAVYEHLARWIKSGTPPPTAPPIEISESGASGTSGESGRSGGLGPARDIVARDAFGNALGGIRLSQHAAATATDTGMNSGGMFCGLLGSHEPFDAARLATLYPSHDAYVAKVKAITEENVKAGFILKADADTAIEEARRSSIGKR